MTEQSSQLSETADTAVIDPDSWQRWIAGRSKVRSLRGMQRRDSSREALFDLASNDYLGLSGHQQLATAINLAVKQAAAGATASRVASGTWQIHRELETELARYTGRREALVFSSGYTANLGVLGALGGPGSLLLLDAHAHASLIDGAKLSGASWKSFAHNDLAEVQRLLRENRDSTHRKPRVVVVLESLYSVLGDCAPLAQAAKLCAEFGALLLVDEAHSLAAETHGSAVLAAGLAHNPQVIVTATLSKALGAQGGVVIFGGAQAGLWREHLLNTARTFIFDTGLAPASAAGALAALNLATPARIAMLKANAELIAHTMAEFSYLAGRVEPAAGAVCSVRMSSAQQALQVTQLLRERGIAVNCFRPPSVPDGISRLRLTAHAHHEPEQLRTALHTVAQSIKEVE